MDNELQPFLALPLMLAAVVAVKIRHFIMLLLPRVQEASHYSFCDNSRVQRLISLNGTHMPIVRERSAICAFRCVSMDRDLKWCCNACEDEMVIVLKWKREYELYMCAGGRLLVYTRLHLRVRVCVCVHSCKKPRGRRGQIGRGQWGSESMLGSGLCSLFTVSRELGRWRKRGRGEGGRGGGCQSRPCGKTPQEEEEDTQQAAREQY